MTRIRAKAETIRVHSDWIRHLSDLARTTRRPGQTLQSRLNELRRECGCA
jgi:hypothetical protein